MREALTTIATFAIVLWLPPLIAAAAAVYTYLRTKRTAVALLFGAYTAVFGLLTWRAPPDDAARLFNQLILNWMGLVVAVIAVVIALQLSKARNSPPLDGE